jgi:hypothetical protein
MTEAVSADIQTYLGIHIQALETSANQAMARIPGRFDVPQAGNRGSIVANPSKTDL